MTDIQQTQQDYTAAVEALMALEAGLELTSLHPVVVSVETEQLDGNTVADSIRLLAPNAQGWLLYPSHLCVLPRDRDQLPKQPLLQAELTANQKSITLRHLGHHIWQKTVVHIRASDTDTATHLAEEVQHLSVNQQLQKLNYKKLWQIEEKGSPRLAMSCFTGFEGGQV